MRDAESIRLRPGMYVGDTTDGSGLMHMLWEIVANALDEHLAGRCTTISVELENDAVTVEDDGRGIPVEPVNDVPFVQHALTSFHDTPTLDGHAPHEHIGKAGLGLFPVCALSAELKVVVHRDGRRFSQRFARGAATSVLHDEGPSQGHGTRITFVPDRSIFKGPPIDPAGVAKRLRELAFLLPNLRLCLRERRTHVFFEPRGLLALVESGKPNLSNECARFTASRRLGQIQVEVAALWDSAGPSNIVSFANIERTLDGGAHANGFRSGLLAGLKRAAPDLCRGYPSRLLNRALLAGLVGVVCVRLKDPTYDRPTKSRLVTPEARRAVRVCAAEAFAEYLRDKPNLCRRFEAALLRGGLTQH